MPPSLNGTRSLLFSLSSGADGKQTKLERGRNAGGIETRGDIKLAVTWVRVSRRLSDRQTLRSLPASRHPICLAQCVKRTIKIKTTEMVTKVSVPINVRTSHARTTSVIYASAAPPQKAFVEKLLDSCSAHAVSLQPVELYEKPD